MLAIDSQLGSYLLMNRLQEMGFVRPWCLSVGDEGDGEMSPISVTVLGYCLEGGISGF